MSTNYSYNVIARRSDAARLHAALERRTDSDQLEYLGGLFERALDDSDESSGLAETSEVAHAASSSLTFCYPADDVLKSSVFAPLMLRAGSQAGCIPIGSIYTDLWAGREYVYFQATGCCHAVSRALFDSPSVRATFTEVGQSADALVVFLDTEGGEGGLCFSIWPGFIQFPIVTRAGWNLDLEMKDLSVDGYCRAVLDSVQSVSSDAEGFWQAP